MKSILSSLLALLIVTGFSFSSFANGEESNKGTSSSTAITCNLQGQIFDHVTGEALAGVKVKICGTNLTTYTDFDGNFSYENLIPGKYDIETSLISYELTTLKNIDLGPEKEHALKVVINPIQE